MDTNRDSEISEVCAETLTPANKLPLSQHINPLLTAVVMSLLVVVIGFFLLRGSTLNKVEEDMNLDKDTIDLYSQQIPDAGEDNIAFEKPPSVELKDGRVISNKENLSFLVPAGWNISDVSEISLPPGATTSLWFLVRDPATNCAIAGGEFPYLQYKQVAFGDRIISSLNQYDSSWYVSKQVFSNSGQQVNFSETPLVTFPVGGIRASSYSNLHGTYNSIYLWQLNGLAVPAECNEKMNNLLQSIDYHIEPVRLNEFSEGILSFLSFRNSTFDHNWLGLTIDTGETYGVIPVSKKIQGNELKFVKDNLIFTTERIYDKKGVPKNSGRIVKIDPFASSTEIIFDTASVGGGIIASFFISGDNFYILTGDDNFVRCLDGWQICKTDLYLLDTNTKHIEKIGSPVTGRSIISVSEGEGTIYLEHGAADAGCGSTKINKFSISNKSEELIFDNSWCSDDQKADELKQELNEVENRVTQNLIYANRIKIQEGKLIPDVLEETNSYKYFIFLP